MKKLLSPKGFTLIEILVASVILTIGIAMVGTVITTVVKKNFLSLRHTQAVNLAQNKIEQLLNEGYESPLMRDGAYENPMNPINETADSSGVFYQFWRIDDVYPIERAKFITSRVEWEDADGRRRQVLLTGIAVDQSN